MAQSYAEHYHPFMPIVNGHFLSPRNIEQTATEEPFLLSAILMIATKTRTDLEAEHRCIWSHLQGMILAVALGSSATKCVGAIEALLLLAEWVPHAHFQQPAASRHRVRRGEDEDSAAWTLVGLAVRQGYLIHLDRYAFRGGEQRDSKSITDRNRLTWTCENHYTILCTEWTMELADLCSHVSLRPANINTYGSSFLVSRTGALDAVHRG